MVIQAKEYMDRERGLLDRNIFYSQELYQLELEKVFTRAWLLIGHESLVPNPNDFFNTYIGEDPVILTRDAKGQLHAMLNICRHRGNRVVRADDGNAKNFMCTYHGWTYSSDGGKLVSVPGLQEAYYGELDVDNLGLIEVAQLDTYAGFVFATWDPEAPSLEDWLGDAPYFLDHAFNRREGGVQVIGPDKWILPTNWKMAADDFGTDDYHTQITHRSATLVRSQRSGTKPPPMFENFSQRNPMYTVRGHAVGGRFVPEGSPLGFPGQATLPVLAKYRDDVQPAIAQRLGTFRATRTRMGVCGIFPNVAVLGNPSMIRLWLPRGPMKTEVWAFQVIDKAIPEEIRHVVRHENMLTFGIAGMQEADDADNWNNCVQASKSLTARKHLQVLSMGIGKKQEEHEDPLPGYRSPTNYTEDRQRATYKRWEEFMNAESWADIKVYPPTVKREGTATFKG